MITRIITGIVLLIFTVSAILYLPSRFIYIISSIIFLLAAWEWSVLIGLKEIYSKIFYLLSIIFLSFSIVYLNIPVMIICCISLVWWLWCFIAACYYDNNNNFLFKSFKNYKFKILSGYCMLIPAWLALNWLHSFRSNGAIWLLLVCSIVWSADTGAYFAGKKWGRNKLIYKVSPGKTWEGVAGGGVVALLIAILLYKILFSEIYKYNFEIKYLLFLSVATIILAIVGDIVESLFKRIQQVKDSGSLLPGHGGILDRIDGLVAAMPLFLLILQLLQYLRIIQQSA